MNRDTLKVNLTAAEGKGPTLYTDSEGVPTFGVGHNANRPITEKAIQQILDDDIDTAVSELDRAFAGWRDHSEARQTALVELSFNLGAVRLAGFIQFWTAMRAKDYQGAHDALLDSKWAGQVHGRAQRLAETILKG